MRSCEPESVQARHGQIYVPRGIASRLSSRRNIASGFIRPDALRVVNVVMSVRYIHALGKVQKGVFEATFLK